MVSTLSLVQDAAHGLLRASGARSVRVPTAAGEAHAYEAHGKGRGTAALLHGFASSATAYGTVVRRLRKDFARIVAPELLGHGRSDVPADGLSEETLRAGLEETLDALLPPGEETLLLGTSLGGAAAVRYAAARPDRVRALVLVSPAGAPLSQDELDALRAKFDVRTRADARRFFAELLHRPPWYSELAGPMLVELLGKGTVREFLGGVRPDHLLRAEELERLSMPVLVVWGRSDRLLPRSSLEFFRENLPKHARVEEPDGLGHSPHLESPDWVAGRVAAFAREVWG